MMTLQVVTKKTKLARCGKSKQKEEHRNNKNSSEIQRLL